MPKNKVKVKDTLENFLFNQIQDDPEFIEFASTYEIPTYITENITILSKPAFLWKNFKRTYSVKVLLIPA